MLAIVLGLLLTVVVALGIVALVALPNLRQGSRILTPDGERAVRRAKEQAKQTPLVAAGTTWHGMVALRRLLARMSRRIGLIWAPVGAALHEALDRMEDRDRQTGGVVEPGAKDVPDIGTEEPVSTEPVSAEEPAPAPRQTRFDVERVMGKSSIGQPRTMPPISGPIPEVSENATAADPRAEPAATPKPEHAPKPEHTPTGKPARNGTRPPDRHPARRPDKKAGHGAGSARRPR